MMRTIWLSTSIIKSDSVALFGSYVDLKKYARGMFSVKVIFHLLFVTRHKNNFRYREMNVVSLSG